MENRLEPSFTFTEGVHQYYDEKLFHAVASVTNSIVLMKHLTCSVKLMPGRDR